MQMWSDGDKQKMGKGDSRGAHVEGNDGTYSEIWSPGWQLGWASKSTH